MAEGTKILDLENLAEMNEHGTKLGWIQIGETGGDGPIIGYGWMPAGFEATAHSHDGSYVEIVLEGSQKIGDDWIEAGTARLVTGGTHYGPLVAGPDGVKYMVIFPSPADAHATLPDGSRFEEALSPMVGIDPATEKATA